MPRIQPLNETQANEKQKGLLDAVQKKLGAKPNILTTMAQSPATLQSYLAFGEALGGASISGKLREQIALAVAGANGCDYCASAHAAISAGMKVTPGEIDAHLAGRSDDPRTAAILRLARSVLETRGFVADADLGAARAAGLSEADIVETVANVVANIFTNYLNHVAATDIDFPVRQARAA